MTDFIDGAWTKGGGTPFTSTNPANGETLWSGSFSENVDAAVDAASTRLSSWASRPYADRLGFARKFGELLEHNRETLADLITAETGKARWETSGEVSAMIAKIDISAQAHAERAGETVKDAPGARSVTRHKPIGVVAVFGPYNFPGHLPNGHVVPALLAGNTVVFKPSELTPAVGERMAQLWEEAGLPAGVLNLVQGAADTGRALAAHDGIDGLFFTGSASVGKLLHQQFAGRPDKMLALEMGGNNALIIGEIADLDAAVFHTIGSAFASAGQRCTCARRVLVPDSAAGDSFLARLVTAAADLVVGPPDGASYMGPLISARAASDLMKAQSNLVRLGGQPLLEMERGPLGEAFVTPGIIDLTGVPEVPDEEYFGPLLSVYRYKDFDDAITLANDTRFGLAAALFDDNESNYQTFWQRSTAGIVNWNRPTTGASSAAPFGGTGASGNHRPAAYYAADYAAYPVASLEAETLTMPAELPPGMGS